MEKRDFIIHGIYNFEPEEIINTGANLRDVQVDLMVRYDKFRTLLGRPVLLLPNGLTTGQHKDPAHRKGLAGDSCIREADGDLDVNHVFKCALQAGFKAIGIYHNEAAYSFHLGVDKKYRFWTGYKKHRVKNWSYGGLIIDPKNLLI